MSAVHEGEAIYITAITYAVYPKHIGNPYMRENLVSFM